MGRSGYTDDCGGWDLIRWRGAVKSAINGARGQAFLRETLAALDAMPEKRLIESELVTDDGCCTMGAVAKARGLELRGIDADADAVDVATVMGIAGALAQEIAYENDEHGTKWEQDPDRPRSMRLREETPEERWTRMRAWVASQLKGPTDAR